MSCMASLAGKISPRLLIESVLMVEYLRLIEAVLREVLLSGQYELPPGFQVEF